MYQIRGQRSNHTHTRKQEGAIASFGVRNATNSNFQGLPSAKARMFNTKHLGIYGFTICLACGLCIYVFALFGTVLWI